MNYKEIFYSEKLSKLFGSLNPVPEFDEQTLVAFEDIFTDLNMTYIVKGIKVVEKGNRGRNPKDVSKIQTVLQYYLQLTQQAGLELKQSDAQYVANEAISVRMEPSESALSLLEFRPEYGIAVITNPLYHEFSQPMYS